MERTDRPAASAPHLAPGDPAPGLDLDVDALARTARSIVSCPAEVELQVDGSAVALGPDDSLGLADTHGRPTMSCHVDSALADAAEEGASVLMTLVSGLGPAGGPDRGAQVLLAGRLVVMGSDHCACCAQTRVLVGIEIAMVLLTRHDGLGQAQQQRLPVERYRSSLHHLNPGLLQRSVEHANDCHQDELRRAVASSTGTRLRDVLGVRLTGLSTRGVEVSWVDPAGAHRTVVDFPSPARTPAELGELLRRSLHAGLC